MTAPDPSLPTSAVLAMQIRASVCNALMGGTLSMRAQGVKYLPQEPAESNEAWTARLTKTTLFPAFEKAVNTMVGKPFETEITLEDDVPQAIKDACEDIDRSGRDLDAFAADVFSQTLSDGIGWMVADCPAVQEGLSLGEEKALGVNPYLVHVPLSSVRGWKFSVENGVHRMTQFRFMECVEVDDGPFATKEIEQVRVLEPGLVTVYQKNEKNEWVIVPELSRKVSLQEMPVITINLGRKGWMSAIPPLENLAWLNVEHWQSKSDQRQILHMARVPLLFGKGLDTGKDGKVVVGPNRLITGSSESDLKWVELQGLSISSGRQDLQDIEDAMRRVAGELLTAKVQKTATETDLEAGEGESQLKKWIHAFEDALEEAFRVMAAWIKEPTGGGICINTDWDDNDLQADMITALTGLHDRQLISRDSVLWKLKAAGFIPPDRSLEDEGNLIDQEKPPMAQGTDPLLSAQDRMMARAAAMAKVQNGGDL